MRQETELVVADRSAVGKVLSDAGFLREGRYWYRPDVDIVVEVPDETLAGSLERLTSIEIDEFRIHVIGREDLIIDRLNACVHWQSAQDCAWVKQMLALYDNILDRTYLEQRAQAEGTLHKLQELEREIMD